MRLSRLPYQTFLGEAKTKTIPMNDDDGGDEVQIKWRDPMTDVLIDFYPSNTCNGTWESLFYYT